MLLKQVFCFYFLNITFLSTQTETLFSRKIYFNILYFIYNFEKKLYSVHAYLLQQPQCYTFYLFICLFVYLV